MLWLKIHQLHTFQISQKSDGTAHVFQPLHEDICMHSFKRMHDQYQMF